MTDSTKHGKSHEFLPDPIESMSAGTYQRLSLWMIQRAHPDPKLHFVYGNVLPTRSQKEPCLWMSREVDRFSKKARLFRHSVQLESAHCQDLLGSIAAGQPVLDALKAHGLDSSSLAHSDLTSMVLHRLPTAYFTGSGHLSTLPPSLWPRTSPAKNAGCNCARLASSDRFSFLPQDASDSETLLRDLSMSLQPETGLSFNRNAGDAFGTLEVYQFPSLDAAEASRVSVVYEKPPSRSVTLKIRRDNDAAEYAVHIRSEQVRDVASDELLTLGAGDSEVTLELPDPIDGVSLRVWRRGDDGRWILWHEQDDHFIRTFSTRLMLNGLTGTVGSSWLDRLSKRLASRVEKFKQISQVSHDQPMEVSTRQQWETGIQKAREIAVRSNAPRSKSRFFRRGWGTDESRFELAEWLKEKLSSHGGSIVLADPYFDVLGLDLVCRSSGAASELVVLTCTQVRSEDDEPAVSRADRLRKGARQYFEILRGLRLRICDLRSANSEASTRQLFHDRYLLLFDQDDNPVEGYNLSTSLQSAAATSPLLVTEIPTDVLDDVADYVQGLLKSNSDRKVETLFPSDEFTRRRRSIELSERRAAAVLAAAQASGRDTEGPGTAIERVTAQGMYDGNRVRLAFSDEELKRLANFLASSSLADAATAWEGIVEAALVGWHEGAPQSIERLLSQPNRMEVAAFMVRFLEAHGSGELLDEDALTHTRTLAHLLERPFDRSIREAARFFDHHHDLPLGTSWSIRLALIYLIHIGPDPIDGLIRELRARKDVADGNFAAQHGPKSGRPSTDTIVRAAKVLANADAVLSAIPAALCWFVHRSGPGLPDAHAASTEPFVRALWAVGHLRKLLEDECEPNAFLANLERLADHDERRLALGHLVYDLRVRANQAAARSAPVEALPEWLRTAIVENAAAKSSVDEVVKLAEFYSGPVLGDWAPSTHQDLILPIAKAGKLTDPSVFDIWDRVLGTRMNDEHASHRDFPLVQVWGLAAWLQVSEQRASLVESLGRELTQAHQALLEPFLASRDYSRWFKAVNSVLWILLRAWAIARARPEGNSEMVSRDLASCAREIATNEDLVSQAIGDMQPMAEHVLADLSKVSGSNGS